MWNEGYPSAVDYSKHHMAMLLVKKNLHIEAEVVLRSVWVNRCDQLGSNHPHTLATAKELAATLDTLDRKVCVCDVLQ